jgi:16S rRNA U516 pseudouridylate synthase RsuA-like enzyme
MITDLEKLSKVLDNSTLSRRVANEVRSDRVRIDHEITTKGAATVQLGGRTFKVVRAPQSLVTKFKKSG